MCYYKACHMVGHAERQVSRYKKECCSKNMLYHKCTCLLYIAAINPDMVIVAIV